MEKHFLLFFCLIGFSSKAVTGIEKNNHIPIDKNQSEIQSPKPQGVYPTDAPFFKEGQSPKTIAFYLQEGVEVLDFAGPMEVFTYAGYKVFTVSATKAPITSQGVLKIQPDYDLDYAPKADIIAFFGGNARAAYTNPKVLEWLKSQEEIQYYFSVCTGAFVLAEAGILDGLTATTFHNALDDLKNNYPEIDVRNNARFVDNGKVITTAGISAGIDGALHLVAKLQGINAAKRTAYYMEYDNWNMGNGLILSDTDPYQATISGKELKGFEGRFEFKGGLEITVTQDKRQRQLQAQMGDKEFPLYHEHDDVFSDINGSPIYFVRENSGAITGYSLERGGEIFHKLK